MASPSKLALDAVVAKLSAPTYGLNDQLSTKFAEYGVPVNDPIRQRPIDWTGRSGNFYKGNLDIPVLIQSTDVSTPLLVVFTGPAFDERRVKSRLFSGTVQVTIRIAHTWDQDQADADFANYYNLFEDALLATFNTPSRPFTGSTHYDGEITITPAQITRGEGDNWLQVIQATLTLGVDI